MKKKSQIQIGETIAVLFVFFILVVIGFMFYAKVFKGNLETEKDELSQARSVGIAQRIMFLPELQCSEDNVIIDNCIDILKLESAQKLMLDNSLYYYDLLEFSDVDIVQIYPKEISWNIYSRTTEDVKNRFVTNVPISLYNSTTRRFTFGILTIETLLK